MPTVAELFKTRSQDLADRAEKLRTQRVEIVERTQRQLEAIDQELHDIAARLAEEAEEVVVDGADALPAGDDRAA
jgi:ElaB/YqjD/DUF883 family membrane-anchored ribosome-binding protein